MRAIFAICALNAMSFAQDSTAIALPFHSAVQPSPSPSAASVQSRPSVAVVPLATEGGVTSAEVTAITDSLASQLQRSGDFRVMERLRMEQVFNEKNAGQPGACDNSYCAVEIGKLLGVDQIVAGSIGMSGVVYSVNLRLVDVKTGDSVHTAARNQLGSLKDVLTDLLPQVAADLEGKILVASTGSLPSRGASEKKRRIWPWVVGGAVVAGGGTAVILLLSSRSSTPTTPSEANFGVSW